MLYEVITAFGEPDEETVAKNVRAVLVKVAAWPDSEPIPGQDPVMCGNAQGHDLASAKEWAGRWVEGIDGKGWRCF